MKTKAVNDAMRDLVRERSLLARKLSGYKYLLRGTIIKRGNVCGTPGCRCKRKDKPLLHGPYNYLSHRSRKRINMIFLNNRKLPYARKGVKEYAELIDIIYRISEINFKILRYHYAELKEDAI
ncbi:MAG: hypothetical protein Q7S30_01740 [Candidatus Omnitrophota bacterium]|nr:hypothetical protein [Candidatus Omnitrophota bacterium]